MGKFRLEGYKSLFLRKKDTNLMSERETCKKEMKKKRSNAMNEQQVAINNRQVSLVDRYLSKAKTRNYYYALL